MKRTSLVSMVCAAALSVACAGNSNQGEQNGASGGDAQQSGSMADRTGNGSGDEHGAAGTAGTSADQSSGSASPAGQSGNMTTRGAGGGDTQQFVRQAASGGLAEVQLGQLAEQRATNDQVKQFARMMVQEHTKSNAELKQAAQAQGIEVPTQLERKHQDILQRLQQLRGAEFDREYMRVMVDSHMEMRDLLDDRADAGGSAANRSTSGATGGNTSGATGTSATGAAGTAGSTQGSDATNQWASKTLPNVERHLQQAQQINSRVQAGGNTGGATGSGSGSSGSPAGSGSGTGNNTSNPGGSGR